MKPLTIGQLRPGLRLEAELDWFFNRATCDMGDQSNYLAVLGRHGPGSAMPSPEDAAEAAHRARRIHGCLRAIDAVDAGVLQCAYVLRAWPIALWDAFGRLTGVVVRLACALDPLPANQDSLEAIEMARAEWLAAECARAGVDPELRSLRREAEVRLAEAHHAYSIVRGQRSSR